MELLLVKIMNRAKYLVLPAVAALTLVACGNGDTVTAEAKQARDTKAVAPKIERGFDGTVGKPGAPFRVSYDVVGTPIVGAPVTVNLRVSTTLGARPVTVSYRFNDESAMMFHDAQPKNVEVSPAANEEFVTQQVTIIPQREGRLYLNVATAVETEEGSRSSVVAIPIQVGTGGRILDEQGEVELDAQGEAVRVLTNDKEVP